MAKLVDVMKESQILNRRQLPLVIDENLTMVLDLSGLNLVCDNVSVRGRQLEDFMKKYSVLTLEEVTQAFQVTYKHCLDILNQTIPCIGCRKSVERVFMDLSQSGYPALSPLLITEEGILTIQQDYLTWPNHLCSLLHGHSTKLNSLASSWPGGRGGAKAARAARRCPLHSLDSARYVTRPPMSYAGGSGWREAWDCMRAACKEQVVLIESCVLLATLETYLRKHRFCGECRTKVMRAYSLLVEEKEPQKEKGFVAPLYAGIRRCLADKHIHLELRTEFIGSLIARAEPELIGNRRERHAKTLEIAQEEVLTCIGICVYERLHKIQMKLREEQCTYQVLATVAVEALCRNFETVVEEKQGVSQLELCYLDMIRDDQVKQQRRELKKLKKRKRREERKLHLMKQQLAKETFECENCAEVYTEDEEHACPSPPSPPQRTSKNFATANTKTKSRTKGSASDGLKTSGLKTSGLKASGLKEEKSKSKVKRKVYNETKAESVDTDENCVCEECSKETSSLKAKKLLSSAAQTQKKTKTNAQQSDSKLKTGGGGGPNNSNSAGEKASKKSSSGGDPKVESIASSKKTSRQVKKSKTSAEDKTRTSSLQSTSSASSVNSVGNHGDSQVRDACGNRSNNQEKYAFVALSNNQVSDACGNHSNANVRIAFGNHSNNQARNAFGNHSNAFGNHGNVYGSHGNAFGSHGNATECSIGSDGGYTSGNNSTLSSPANSEVACSDGFCNHEGPEDCPVDASTGVGSECDDVTNLFHSKLSLEQMLHSNGCHGDGCYDDGDADEDQAECWIPREEVEKFRARVQNVEEKRQRLRATLMQRFQNMCDRSRCPF